MSTEETNYLTDIDRIFSAKSIKKYPPDGSNFKFYIYGLLLVILVLFITIVGVATNLRLGQANQSPFNSPDHVPFKGSYLLNKHDDNFEKYLLSLDIPGFAINQIKSVKEVIKVIEPSWNNPNWTFTYTTGTF